MSDAPIVAAIVRTPWNDMILLTTDESRGVGIMLESVVEAQNETNRLLAIIANRLPAAPPDPAP